METLIAVFSGIFVYALILSLVSKKAIYREKINNRLVKLGKSNTRKHLDEDLNLPFSERVVKPLVNRFVQVLSRMVPSGTGESTAKQKKLLEQAGWAMSVEDYNALRIVVIIVCAGIGALMALVMQVTTTQILLYVLIGAYAGFAILRFVVTAQGTKRRQALERQLPDMLDLLSVSVEAGLGFEQALLEITKNMDGPLIDEIAVTYREMSMGRTRRDALILLGERCNSDDVKSFTGALVQAGQLGISIKNVLQSQSAALRRSRRNKIQEEAAKLSTKILFPMLLFIFPVLFIVLLGPAVMNIVENLG